MKKFLFLLSLLVAVAMFVSALGSCVSTQKTIEERNEKLGGESSAEGNYFEAQQIAQIEAWKDNPDKIVNVYLINPVTGGLLIDPVQCKGVPASSTESLEPNQGVPYGSTTNGWKVPLDGADVVTQEMAGRDGSFGDPVHSRQCMSVDGNYYEWPAYGIVYLITSASYTFPDATVQRDYETEAKLMLAEQILKNGGCIDVETLQEIPCVPDTSPENPLP